jgi:hypothetical protein
MNDAERQTALYESIWSKDPSYGTSASDVADTVIHRIAPHMRRLGINRPSARVIDFGAGDGRMLKCMWANCYLARGVGIDVVEPSYRPEWMSWVRTPMWECFGSGFDYAISTDALEHLPPGQVDDALTAIARAAPHGFLRISLKEDKYGTERGLHLHESVFSSGEWVCRLRSAGIEPSSVRVYYDAPHANEAALEVWF